MPESQEQETSRLDQPAEPAPSLIGRSPLFPTSDPPETRSILVCVWNQYTSSFEPVSVYASLADAIDSAANYLVYGHAVILKTVVPEIPPAPGEW